MYDFQFEIEFPDDKLSFTLKRSELNRRDQHRMSFIENDLVILKWFLHGLNSELWSVFKKDFLKDAFFECFFHFRIIGRIWSGANPFPSSPLMNECL